MDLSYDVSENTLLKYILDFGALNGMAVCRAVNLYPPLIFDGCYGHDFDINRRGPRCLFKERGCKVDSARVYHILKRMEKKGLIHSVLLRWFDGRDSPNGAWQFDVFRFWFIDKKGLAKRLHSDIETHLEK